MESVPTTSDCIVAIVYTCIAFLEEPTISYLCIIQEYYWYCVQLAWLVHQGLRMPPSPNLLGLNLFLGRP